LRSFEAGWLARGGSAHANPLSALREKAMQRVLELGLPTSRDETWKYTNLRPWTSRGFAAAPARAVGAVDASALSLLGGGGATVLLVNGHPVLPHSGDQFFDGIEIKSLRELSRTDPAMVAERFMPLSDADQARWTLLNTALFEDGLYLKIAGRIDTPLVLLHLLTSQGPSDIAHPAVIIDAAPGSKATIIQQYLAQGPNPPLCNSVTRIAAARDSQIEHYRVFTTGADADHIDSLILRLEAMSRCAQFTLVLGGGLVRTALEADLGQAGARLDDHALLVGHESRHVDCVNIVSHRARDTVSRQTARAIASGSSRVVFNSKVVVSAGAEHADSQQSCRGLLLSPTAEIDTRPQLEIHAHDVKCAHGATTGRLNPDMLFYMLSRGLDRQTAQSLLVYAFLADVLTGMSVPTARSGIEDALIAQLPDPQLVNQFR
jgi:Fe-S cluster assembly protein SufD